MSIGQSMLGEFDHEMANTRKTLERLPLDKLEWKPDPKSMSLGRLAGHVVEMVGWGKMIIDTDSLDMNPNEHKPLEVTSRDQIVGLLDQNAAALRSAMAATSDADMMKEWALKIGGNTLFSMPRVACIRSMIMNHIIHHRAQLTVYYRMVGVPVPALYGPSADEGNAAAA